MGTFTWPRTDGAAVVIDVIRAFTTAAAAFEAGASELICVADSDRARALRRSIPGALLLGEECDRPPWGFDYGNSPRQFAGMDLGGRTVVQRPSNGNSGLAMSAGGVLVAGAAVNASPTARLVARHLPVRLVCTGEETSEDQACAEHLRSLLLGKEVNNAELSDAVQRAADELRLLAQDPWTAEELASYDADVRACAEVDRHDFAMVGRRTAEDVRLDEWTFRRAVDRRVRADDWSSMSFGDTSATSPVRHLPDGARSGRPRE